MTIKIQDQVRKIKIMHDIAQSKVLTIGRASVIFENSL